MSRKRTSYVDRDPSEIPYLEDLVFSSDLEHIEKFIVESGLPEKRFEWVMARNLDTSEWWFQVQARPTLGDKCIGRWLWLRMKVRLLGRKMRSFRA